MNLDNTIIQIIASSGVVGIIVSLTVNRVVTKMFENFENQKKQQQKLEKILVTRLDKLSVFVELMAQKLHDAGVINGDLEKVRSDYAEIDEMYDEFIRDIMVGKSVK